MPDFDMPPAGSWEERGGWVVRALMRDLGLTADQAAGLVGNLGYESAGFTKLQEIRPAVAGSRGGTGWSQWTGQRRRNFEFWCLQKGMSPSSDEANYGFLIAELRTPPWMRFVERLKAAPAIEAACWLTHKEYEAPADVLDNSYRSGPDRLRWAHRALAGAQGMAGAAHRASNTADIDDDIREAVRRLQTLLAKRGLYKDQVDADPGPLTQGALAAWRLVR